MITYIATFTVIFTVELVSAYILWFILKKIVKTTKFYRIAIICLIVSAAIGYVGSSNIVGYEVTMDYLETIDDQRIEETGQGITLQEENEYKEVLVHNKDYQKYLITSSIKLSLPPFLLVILIMIYSVNKAYNKLPPSSAELSNPPKAN